MCSKPSSLKANMATVSPVTFDLSRKQYRNNGQTSLSFKKRRTDYDREVYIG